MLTGLKTRRKNRLAIFAIVLGALGIMGNGCASPSSRYQPLISSPSDGAQVVGTHQGYPTHWYKLTLEKVDGRKISLPWWKTDWNTPLLIDPGERTLQVRCRFEMDFHSDSITADLNASLQPGHSYQLRCDITDNDTVVFWVEDTKTHLNASRPITTPATPPSLLQPTAEAGVFLLLRVLLLISTGG